ncbi:MAG: tannase/feruloyl esterase family alpha/beta hydrolase [Bryobacterales bacterium]|nr:tannase/feruloyl esterase family alpha/beta hydrolase [Bryobacterales bacterium]
MCDKLENSNTTKRGGPDVRPLYSFLPISLLVSAFFSMPARAASCESLGSLALPQTTITSAQSVSAGRFQPPSSPGPTPFRNLPAFCRVVATLKPANDSDIKIEVWMPAEGWNGKFQATGNGGWSGAVNHGALARALALGYAAAGTDTGHSGGRGEFALGHPEKLIDFGYRAVHEMTVKAKAIIAAYYGNGPRLSYWVGCSSGGKQGLKEAQQYPADYDGILAGAPANYWTHLMVGDLWVSQTTLKDPAAYIPKEKYPALHKAALAACDALDGVTDGLIENPMRCRFDPAVLACKDGDSPACLTTPQVESARKIYSGPVNPRTKKQIFPGLEPGSELGWGPLAGGPHPFQIADDHFKYVVFKDPNWDFRTLNLDSHVALTDKIDKGTLNAINPDLRKFLGRGGKMILYHGWNDQLIAPRNTVNYYESMVAKSGGAAKVSQSIRLFMAPGMAHCAGGEGPNTFDALTALDQWVEHGKAPEQIIAAHRADGKVDRTRPWCPYPQVAKYKGSGSTDDAANFVCAPQKGR